jgi:L-ascorbate metabolism protein UlaG (beta-lactamase superfamily)
MRLIKFTHACVRLEDGDRRLLIDPGIWTEREAYQGVTDILVTHEHDDHIDIEQITDLFESGSGPRCVVGALWRVSRSGSSWCRWGLVRVGAGRSRRGIR